MYKSGRGEAMIELDIEELRKCDWRSHYNKQWTCKYNDHDLILQQSSIGAILIIDKTTFVSSEINNIDTLLETVKHDISIKIKKIQQESVRRELEQKNIPFKIIT